MAMDYSRAADWIVAEDSFDPEYLGKCESIMCQGNGYLCLCNAADEFNAGEQRDLFVAGTMWNEVMAAACISVLPIILLDLIFNKWDNPAARP